jgi:hypothetical protein
MTCWRRPLRKYRSPRKLSGVYHVQIREGVHAVRAFNLTADQVRGRFIAPLTGSELFTVEDHEFDPRKTRLTILDGRELRPDQISMGRGWPNAEKYSTDVTVEMLEQPQPAQVLARPQATDQLKERLIGRLSAGEITLLEIVELAATLTPGQRVSEQVAISELAVWELLHQETAELQQDGDVLSSDDWQQTLLALGSWLRVTDVTLTLA